MKVVVLMSGGLDSSVLAAYAKRELFCDVHGLGVNYGQRHAVELQHAAMVAAAMDIPFQVADLTSLRGLLGGSSQTDASIPVPEGHYADESMKATVVPNRNMIMLSVAAGHAIALGARAVLYAAHSGDHPIYPDCRPQFVLALAEAMALCHYEPIQLTAPFVNRSKANIARLGRDLSVPMDLTWSCYKGGEKHCGKCGTCVERREAFQLAGVPDPTTYE